MRFRTAGLRTRSRTRTRRWRALPLPPVCEPEAEPEPGGGARFRTAGLRTRSRTRTEPSQRRCDTPRGPEVSLSGSRPSPADQWHLLRACLCEPEPGGGVRFCTAGLRTRSRTQTRRWRAFPHRRSPNPKPTSYGGGGASLGRDLCKRALRVSGLAWQGGKPNSSSPPHTGLSPVVLQGPLLAAALPGCRPLLQSSLHLQEDAVWGGLLWRIV